MLIKFVKTLTKVPFFLKEQKRWFMEVLKGQTLIDIEGNNVDANAVLANKQYILYYFSASWCSPCKKLLPQIKSIYEEILKRQAKIEVIYISFDTDKDSMMEYFKNNHGKWYAIPYGNVLAEELRLRFDVTYVPYLTLVKNDGTIVSKNAKQEIEDIGVNVLTTWLS